MKKKHFKFLVCFTFFCCAFLGLGTMSAQNISITGKCVDNHGPLPGVTVKVKGSKAVVVTDIDGKYSITVSDQSAVLQFTSIGYAAMEEKVGSRRQIDVTMADEERELDELVVVGYKSVQKKFAGGSMASVSAKDIANMPAASVADLLSGKATGMSAIGLGGSPGRSGTALVIRGNSVMSGTLGEANQYSNPLFVIDGMPTALEDLATHGQTSSDYLASLNVDDIASIDVLKDASASAIYGSRGANGVIIIQTKKGTVGKLVVGVKASFGFTTKPGLTSTPVGAAERRMKMNLARDTWEYGPLRNNLPIMLTDSLNPSFNNNMDYQGMFYQDGLYQDYGLSLRGGSEDLNYRLSLGYFDEEGILKNTGFKRYTLNIHLQQKPWKNVENQTVIRIAYKDTKPGSGNSNSRGNFPVSPLDMKSSLFAVSDDQSNFLSGSLGDYVRTEREVLTSVTNDLVFRFSENLIYQFNVSGSSTSTKMNNFQPSTLRTEKNGKANYDYAERLSTIVGNKMAYNGNINKDHFLSVLAGTEYSYGRNERNKIEAIGGSGDVISTIEGYAKDDIGGSTSISENAMMSYYTQATYRFLDRYQIDLSYRREASSRFGKNKRWANFPSGTVFWIFNDEPFMEFAKDWLSFGKIKYSIGVAGSQASMSDYLRYNSYSLGYNSFTDMKRGTMGVNSYNKIMATIPDYSKLADNYLTWEETKETNFGLDIRFFKDRLQFVYDYYNRNVEGQLFNVEFPDYTGFDMVKANIGGQRNTGHEFSVEAHVFPRTNELTLSLSAGIAYNENIITKLPNNDRDYINAGYRYGYTVGKPSMLFYGLIYDGVLKSMDDLPVNPFTGLPLNLNKGGTWGKVEPGYPMFRDVSGDYMVTDEADQDVGLTSFNPNPKYDGRFSINMRYKQWNLGVNTVFNFGRDVYDQTSQKILDRYDWSGWVDMAAINLADYDVWSPSNPNAYYPSVLPHASGVNQRYAFRPNTTMWFEDGDYWKINNIQFGYSFNKDWLKKTLRISRLEVFGTMYNVWQWQASDKLQDATMVDSRGYAFGDGYPNPRKYVMGINVEF